MNVFRRGRLTPLRGDRRSTLTPFAMSCTGYRVRERVSGGIAGCGDDRADPARDFVKGKSIKEIVRELKGVAQHGAQGAAFGRDLSNMRARSQPLPKLERWRAELTEC